MSEKKEFNKQTASALWLGINVTVDHFHPHLRRHNKVDFLGFARVTIDASAVLAGMIITLAGLQVKILKGEARIDPKDELNEKSGKRYPVYFPRSAELRKVLTMRVFENPDVLAAIAAVNAMPKPNATSAGADEPASDDPFADAAGDDLPF